MTLHLFILPCGPVFDSINSEFGGETFIEMSFFLLLHFQSYINSAAHSSTPSGPSIAEQIWGKLQIIPASLLGDSV